MITRFIFKQLPVNLRDRSINHDVTLSDPIGEVVEVLPVNNMSTAADLLKQGAGECEPAHLASCVTSYCNVYNLRRLSLACNVLYLNSVETESLTGPQAIAKATEATMSRSPRPSATVVHFKVSAQGITLTDSQRRYAH